MEIALRLLDRRVLTALVVMVLLRLALRLYGALVVKPRKLRQMLKEQGIDGPHQTLLLGNIREIRKARAAGAPKSAPGVKPVRHDCAGALFPFFMQWRKQYGKFTLSPWTHTQCKRYIQIEAEVQSIFPTFSDELVIENLIECTDETSPS